MLIVFEVLVGIVVAAVTLVFLEPISRLLGATDELMADCILYGAPLIAVQAFFFLHTSFQSFLVTGGQAETGTGDYAVWRHFQHGSWILP